MTEWVVNAPWWVFVGSVVALIGIGVWVGKVNSKLDSLGVAVRYGLAEVREDIKKILEKQAPPPDVGEKISAAVSAKKWAAEHASRLLDEASGKQEFEVFDMCVAYVAEQFEKDKSFQRNIRATAYDFGIEAKQIRKVYEVELRNRILSLG